MVHAQQIKEARARRKSKDAKRARSFDGVSSKVRLEIQDKPWFKKCISNQVPSKCPKARGCLTLSPKGVSNPKPKRGRYTSSPTKKPTCG